MRVNIFYEDEEYADIVDIPQNNIDIEQEQLKFCKWLFDKSNNHKYWIYEDGEKKYCSYGTDAFVEWLNDTVLKDNDEKASISRSNTNEFCRRDISLYF